MKGSIVYAASGAVMMTLLAGCSISTTVKPVANEKISQLCIMENQGVLMDGFLPELKTQVESYGIKAPSYAQALPADCVYHMEYSANWQWDLAMYLSYAELKVYKGNGMIGEAVYDARSGGANMDKFGTTDTFSLKELQH